MSLLLDRLRSLEIDEFSRNMQKWLKEYHNYLIESPFDENKFKYISSYDKSSGKETIWFGGFPIPEEFLVREESKWIIQKFKSLNYGYVDRCIGYQAKIHQPFFKFSFLLWLIDNLKNHEFYQKYSELMYKFLFEILSKKNKDFYEKKEPLTGFYITTNNIDTFLHGFDVIEKIVFTGMLVYNQCLSDFGIFTNEEGINELFDKWTNKEDFNVGIITPEAFSFIEQSKQDNFIKPYSKLWEIIHPKIIGVSKDLFDNGHYSEAIQRAMVKIIEEIKEIVKIATGEELDGDSLINRALSGTDPILKLNNLITQSEKNFQKGYFFIFKGAVFAIRNPLSHESSKISNLEAFHKLIIINDLMRVLEGRIV